MGTRNSSARKLNPHNRLVALDPPRKHPPRRWQCHYCGVVGTLDEVQAIECTYEYPPCEYCGQTPECAIDCPGIALALSGQLTPEVDVHIVGSIDPKA